MSLENAFREVGMSICEADRSNRLVKIQMIANEMQGSYTSHSLLRNGVKYQRSGSGAYEYKCPPVNVTLRIPTFCTHVILLFVFFNFNPNYYF